MVVDLGVGNEVVVVGFVEYVVVLVVVVKFVGDVVVEVDVTPSEFSKHSFSLRCENLSKNCELLVPAIQS